MAGITINGVGSGIEINSLVDQLVAAERDPAATRLEARETIYEAQVSGFGLVRSSLAELEGAFSQLGRGSLFEGRRAGDPAPEVFTATAREGAPVGTFSIEVESLASAQKLRSEGFADADAVVGTGRLELSLGGEVFSVEVDAANGTLAGVRDAINGSAENPGIQAGIVTVDDGAGGSESRLVLSTEAVGSANAMEVRVTGDGDGDDGDAAGLSRLVYAPGEDGTGPAQLVELDAASDAAVYVDGQLATRSTNRLTDVIEGVTLELLKAEPGESYELTVSRDTQAAVAAVEGFVGAFNKMGETLDGLTDYDAEAEEGGVLIGDATLRGLEQGLRRALSGVTSEVPGDYRSLADLGLTTGRDGRLSLETGKLSEALASEPQVVAELFAGAGGLAARLGESVSGYARANGLLDTRVEGLNSRIEDIGEQREALDRRIASLEERLLAQFSAMDRLVAELQSTGDFLTQQLASLPNMNQK